MGQDALVQIYNLSDFPASPQQGDIVSVNGVLWNYSTIDGLAAWYPLTNTKQSYTPIQGVAATSWTITHSLGTSRFVYTVYDSSGNLIGLVNRTVIDDNACTLSFTDAQAGYAVLVADAEVYAAGGGASDSITIPSGGNFTVNFASGAGFQFSEDGDITFTS